MNVVKLTKSNAEEILSACIASTVGCAVIIIISVVLMFNDFSFGLLILVAVETIIASIALRGFLQINSAIKSSATVVAH